MLPPHWALDQQDAIHCVCETDGAGKYLQAVSNVSPQAAEMWVQIMTALALAISDK